MLFLSTDTRAVNESLACPLPLALADEIFCLLQKGFRYLHAAFMDCHSFRQFVEEEHVEAHRMYRK